MNAAWIFYLYVLPLLLAGGAVAFGYFYTRADEAKRRHHMNPGE